MKGDVIFSDGVEKRITKWKCSLLENFQDEEERIIPLQYEFNDRFFIEDISLCLKLAIEEIIDLLDFWNYMGCDERMYFFYMCIYKSLHCGDSSYLNFEVKMKKELPLFKAKHYYNELIIILHFLREINLPSPCYEIFHISVIRRIYWDDEVLIPFINFLDSTGHWREFCILPICFGILDKFVTVSPPEDYSKIYSEKLEELLQQTLMKVEIKEIISKNMCSERDSFMDFHYVFGSLEELRDRNQDFYHRFVNFDLRFDFDIRDLLWGDTIFPRAVDTINFFSSVFGERFEFKYPPDILDASTSSITCYHGDIVVYDVETKRLKMLPPSPTR